MLNNVKNHINMGSKLCCPRSSRSSESSGSSGSSESSESSGSTIDQQLFNPNNGNVMSQLDEANDEYQKKHAQYIWEQKEAAKKKEEDAKKQKAEKERKKKEMLEQLKRDAVKTTDSIEQKLAIAIKRQFVDNGYHIDYPFATLIKVPSSCKKGYDNGSRDKLPNNITCLTTYTTLYEQKYPDKDNIETVHGKEVVRLLKKRGYDVKCVSTSNYYDSYSSSSSCSSSEYDEGMYYMFIKDKPTAE
jgi:hypothetical protein